MNHFQLKNLTWLWKSLDPHAKSEYAALKAINESLLRGEKLEVHNYQTVVPFLQPTLEIMSGQDSNYLDGTSFASEVGAFLLFLSVLHHLTNRGIAMFSFEQNSCVWTSTIRVLCFFFSGRTVTSLLH